MFEVVDDNGLNLYFWLLENCYFNQLRFANHWERLCHLNDRESVKPHSILRFLIGVRGRDGCPCHLDQAPLRDPDDGVGGRDDVVDITIGNAVQYSVLAVRNLYTSRSY